MKQVTFDEFYDLMGPLDVEVSVEDKYSYPYTSLFTLKSNRKVVGKAVSNWTDNQPHNYPVVKTYFVDESLKSKQ